MLFRSNILRSMWERGWSFIKKAGTIILLSTIILWFLMSFGWEGGSFGIDDFFHGKFDQHEKLKELVGHTPKEVLLGALLGIFIGIIMS